MAPRRKDQGVVAKDKLKAKTEPCLLATEDVHTPTEVATSRASQMKDAMDQDVVAQVGASSSDKDFALAEPAANTDTTIACNVPSASQEEESSSDCSCRPRE
eukprot:3245416-Amphidinium_carterae.1